MKRTHFLIASIFVPLGIGLSPILYLASIVFPWYQMSMLLSFSYLLHDVAFIIGYWVLYAAKSGSSDLWTGRLLLAVIAVYILGHTYPLSIWRIDGLQKFNLALTFTLEAIFWFFVLHAKALDRAD